MCGCVCVKAKALGGVGSVSLNEKGNRKYIKADNKIKINSQGACIRVNEYKNMAEEEKEKSTISTYSIRAKEYRVYIYGKS